MTDLVAVAKLWRAGKSERQIAKDLGVSRTLVWLAKRRIEDDEPQRSGCDSCGDEGAKVVRFSLAREVIVKGRRTRRVCGRIDLCERCWRPLKGAAKDMRPSMRKLSPDQISQIKDRRRRGVSIDTLASDYRCSPDTIYRALRT